MKEGDVVIAKASLIKKCRRSSDEVAVALNKPYYGLLPLRDFRRLSKVGRNYNRVFKGRGTDIGGASWIYDKEDFVTIDEK